MQITITIPDEIAPRVIDGVAGQHGYQETVLDEEGNEIPNPETKAQFAKRVILEGVKNAVLSWEAVQAAEAARTAAIDLANEEIVLS